MKDMSIIRIALVEDDELEIRKVTGYLERFQDENGLILNIKVFNDGEDLAEDYRPDYDLILMDIQMRFMDGMTAAQKIREADPEVILIFLTSMAGYAIKGYEVDALDYILKPVSYELFSRKLKRAVERLDQDRGHHLVLTMKDGMFKLDVSRILYIESRGHQMIYRTVDGEYEARGRLDDLEKELKPYGFFRSNRGYLVNLSRVAGVKNECCLIGEDRLPISRQKKADFMRELTRLL